MYKEFFLSLTKTGDLHKLLGQVSSLLLTYASDKEIKTRVFRSLYSHN